MVGGSAGYISVKVALEEKTKEERYSVVHSMAVGYIIASRTHKTIAKKDVHSNKLDSWLHET